ncbi:MAG TPA: phytoene/squalene synthase family protein [Rhizomicrobium sp.]|jgi:phytoene synthase
MVREADPDRFMSALFAPAAKRQSLFALYAFNTEIARIAENVSQPMLGEIRLQWWRETVEAAKAGNPRDHDIARALAETFVTTDLPFAPFDAMLDARVFDSTPDAFETLDGLEDYADVTSGNLMRLAARVLDGTEHDELARHAGIAYALAGLVRAIPFHAARRKLYLPMLLLSEAGLGIEEVFAGRGQEKLRIVIAALAARVRHHLAIARSLPKSRRALAAFLPAATAPLYMRIATAPDFDPFRTAIDVPMYRRQLAMLRANLRGTL